MTRVKKLNNIKKGRRRKKIQALGKISRSIRALTEEKKKEKKESA